METKQKLLERFEEYKADFHALNVEFSEKCMAVEAKHKPFLKPIYAAINKIVCKEPKEIEGEYLIEEPVIGIDGIQAFEVRSLDSTGNVVKNTILKLDDILEELFTMSEADIEYYATDYYDNLDRPEYR